MCGWVQTFPPVLLLLLLLWRVGWGRGLPLHCLNMFAAAGCSQGRAPSSEERAG